MIKPTRAPKSRLVSAVFIFCAAGFCCPALLWAQSDAELRENVLVAKSMVQWLNEKNWQRLKDELTLEARERLPLDQLQSTWNSFSERLGGYQGIAGLRLETGPEDQSAVAVSCLFERDTIQMKIVFNRHQKIADLSFSPAEEPGGLDLNEEAQAAPPAPSESDLSGGPRTEGDLLSATQADPVRSGIIEQELTIGKDPWSLPATLTLPPGEGPFPGVVLVHGSGPQDRDETIGPNKPFRDIALGLSGRGIAVLRYEKRTKIYPLQMAAIKDLTVKDEVIDDALAACSAMRMNKKIDPKQLFVLGHSMGGWMLPRIAAADRQLAGGVILAGNTRPLERLIVDQLRYFASLDGTVTAAEQAQLDQLQAQVDKIKDLKPGVLDHEAPAPFGVAPSYWLDLRGYQPAEIARELNLPLLILQGERDYQVTLEDFEGWKQALQHKPGVKLMSYPGLNHLFIEGEGKSRPSEYEKPGHVSAGVIDDIAGWIWARAAAPQAGRAGVS